MPREELLLSVPLRSNAHCLVAGSGVSALRRRLKFGSLIFDRILLEEGRLSVTVGPEGSMVANVGERDEAPAFQSPSARRVRPGERFTMSIGAGEPTVGSMQTFINSETTYRWEATLAPFGQEAPSDCDWMHWVRPQLSSEAKRLVSQWSRQDNANPALQKKWPEHIVRNALVKHANHDLVLAASAGVAVTQDAFHRRIYDARYARDSSWQPRAFLLPVLVPEVGDLSWEAVRDLRRHKGMARLRQVLRELENRAIDEASDGDLERAARVAFDDYLLNSASESLTSLRGAMKTQVASLAIGAVTGAVSANWVGPIGIAGGMALGIAPEFVVDLKNVRSSRRSWITAYQSLVAVVR